MHNFFLKLRGLKDIKRCNTQRRIHDLDVAQHSYYTAILSMMVADELVSKGHEINKELVLKKALLHDAEEVYTGDIIYPVKHKDDEIAQALKIVTQKMGDDFYADFDKKADRYRKIQEEAKQGLEGKIVAICDMAELMVYCFEEISMGNTNMMDLFVKSSALVQKYCLYADSSVLQNLLNSVSCSSVLNETF